MDAPESGGARWSLRGGLGAVLTASRKERVRRGRDASKDRSVCSQNSSFFKKKIVCFVVYAVFRGGFI